MANEASMSISGRLTADPQLRFTPNGDAVASFTVAHSRRKYDKSTGQWVDDGETLFMPVTAWRLLAEGAADQLRKGDAVVVVGTVKQNNWEKDGQKHSRVELVAEDIGSSVRARKRAEQQEAVQEPAW